jgi:hypothetical protein
MPPSGLPLGEFAVNNFELFAQLTILLLQLLDPLPEGRDDRGSGIVRRAYFSRWRHGQGGARPQLLNPRFECRLLIKPSCRDGCRARHRAEIDRLPLHQKRLNGALGAFKRRLMPRLCVLS